MAAVPEADRQRGALFLPLVRRALHHGHAHRCDTCAPVGAHNAATAALGRAATGGAR